MDWEHDDGGGFGDDEYEQEDAPAGCDPSACPHPPENRVVDDGKTLCSLCGQVMSEDNLTDNILFEGSGRDSRPSGTFVGAGRRSRAIVSFTTESRELTLRKARGEFDRLAHQLQLTTHHVDCAVRLYSKALDHNLRPSGRPHVFLAACLYIVCRDQRSPHMLMDFSVTLQESIWVLAKTYMKLVQRLGIRLPDSDPGLYIHRFVSRLNFGSKAREVSATALKLVCRMQRDWLDQGRRPAGIVAAALVVASSIHGVPKKPKDVVKVVRLHEVTLRHRLVEMQAAASGRLTLEQLEKVDSLGKLAENDDKYVTALPPRLKKLRELERMRQLVEQLGQERPNSSDSDELLAHKAPRIVARRKAERRANRQKRRAGLAVSSSDSSDSPEEEIIPKSATTATSSSSSADVTQPANGQTPESSALLDNNLERLLDASVHGVLDDEANSTTESKTKGSDDDGTNAGDDEDDDEDEEEEISEELLDRGAKEAKKKLENLDDVRELDELSKIICQEEQTIQEETQRAILLRDLGPEQSVGLDSMLQDFSAASSSPAALAKKDVEEEEGDPLSAEWSDGEGFSEIDDQEIQAYLVTDPTELRIRKELFDQHNAGVLEMKTQKQLERQKKLEEKRAKGPQTRKKKVDTRADMDARYDNSATGATAKWLANHGSAKINYDVLKEVMAVEDDVQDAEEEPEEPVEGNPWSESAALEAAMNDDYDYDDDDDDDIEEVV